jgi:hypothetical protein
MVHIIFKCRAAKSVLSGSVKNDQKFNKFLDQIIVEYFVVIFMNHVIDELRQTVRRSNDIDFSEGRTALVTLNKFNLFPEDVIYEMKQAVFEITVIPESWMDKLEKAVQRSIRYSLRVISNILYKLRESYELSKFFKVYAELAQKYQKEILYRGIMVEILTQDRFTIEHIKTIIPFLGEVSGSGIPELVMEPDNNGCTYLHILIGELPASYYFRKGLEVNSRAKDRFELLLSLCGDNQLEFMGVNNDEGQSLCGLAYYENNRLAFELVEEIKEQLYETVNYSGVIVMPYDWRNERSYIKYRFLITEKIDDCHYKVVLQYLYPCGEGIIFLRDEEWKFFGKREERIVFCDGKEPN